MDSVQTSVTHPAQQPRRSQVARQTGMSYKFQRLREQIREAIASGELQGKLPGERALARRFDVNAKTLGKALTDLAAEGVLDRSIGRGTYVRGSEPATQASAGRWLVLADEAERDGCLVRHLRAANPQVDVVDAAEVSKIRPSFLNTFAAVVDLAASTPPAFLRDLVVRNVPVVAVGREPNVYSMHAVLADAALGLAKLGRDLLLGGHRRLVAVEPPGSTLVARALRQAAARYAPDAAVDACDSTPEDVAAMTEHGAGAFVCDSVQSAQRVMAALEGSAGTAAAGEVSVAAVGCACGELKPHGAATPCTGYFVDCRQVAESVVQLLRSPPARPAAVWLVGTFIDRGTVAPAGASGEVFGREEGEIDRRSLHLAQLLL